MTEPPASRLLDQALITTLGPVDDATTAAIEGICDDALTSVLGPALAATIRADSRLLPLTAPWVMDLARGLQYQSRNGPREPASTELLSTLAPGLAADLKAKFAETVDLTIALTLSRVTDHVLGPGSGARHLAAHTAVPWLAGLKLGYRIGLALELLRLSASH